MIERWELPKVNGIEVRPGYYGMSQFTQRLMEQEGLRVHDRGSAKPTPLGDGQFR